MSRPAPTQPDLAPGTTFAWCIRCEAAAATGTGVLCAGCFRVAYGLRSGVTEPMEAA